MEPEDSLSCMFALANAHDSFFILTEVGHEQSTTIEPAISPIILDVWLQHVSDPFISIDAVEVLEVILCIDLDSWKFD